GLGRVVLQHVLLQLVRLIQRGADVRCQVQAVVVPQVAAGGAHGLHALLGLVQLVGDVADLMRGERRHRLARVVRVVNLFADVLLGGCHSFAASAVACAA